MTSPAQDPVRVARRRREHERQAVVFGLLIAALAVTGLGAVAVYTGAIESPFDQPINTPGAVEEETTGPVPCLPTVKNQPDGALPVPYSDVRLRILNASATPGLARAHADVLGERGFDVIFTGDLDHVNPRSELRFGVSGIVRAYTLAAQFPEIAMVLDDREGPAIDLLVGEEYERPLPDDHVPLRANQPLENAPDCVAAKEIEPVEREYAVGEEPETAAAQG